MEKMRHAWDSTASSSVVVALMIMCVAVMAQHGDEGAMKALQRAITASSSSRWNTTDPHFCRWYGVTCSTGTDTVTKLQLSRLGLSGNMSALFTLRSLTSLDLSYNGLSGNIPSAVSHLASLQFLDLSSNGFTGRLPSEIGELKSLMYLNLSGNALTGQIPPQLSRLTQLRVLNLNNNKLIGSIPETLRLLGSLQELQLSGNRLVGLIPGGLADLTTLQTFTAYENKLTGPIPHNLGLHSDLSVLNLHSNMLMGPIPPSIFASGKLQVLVLTVNRLEGSLPPSVSNCTALSSLRIGSNRITGSIPPGVGSLESLTYFEADGNLISGFLVPEFSRCTNLSLINLASNALTGTLPPQLGSLSNLEELILSNNSLSGEIPTTLSGCKNLSKLDLSLNRFNGSIPPDLCSVPHLQYLLLNGNSLRGQIPPEIGRCKRLLELQLGSNYLRGTIPLEIGDMNNLQIALNLSFNHLQGTLPQRLGKLDKLVSLDVSDNRLLGTIPYDIKGMESLIDVDFSNNMLVGTIPTFRPFQNSPPSSFVGNRGLCGEPLKACSNVSSPPANHKASFGKVLAVVLGSGLLVFLAVTVVVVLFVLKERKSEDLDCVEMPPPAIVTGNTFVDSLKQAISFQSAVDATLKDSNKLSSGTFSVVYKAAMPSGLMLTVRKLKSIDRAVNLHQNKLIRELEKLAKISQESIMTPIGFIIYDDSVLLLHHYFPNGTLAQLLRSGGGVEADWERRLSIVVGVAQGLAFLHHCHTPVIHLDIASANIFLDTNYNPLIGEVEVSKLLDPSKGTASITTVAGSFGYIPPEYAYTMQVTAAGNVYSFGVILLEILTSRLPVEEEFGEGTDLVRWVQNAALRKETPEQILDPRLSTISFTLRQQMLAVLKVALLCTDNTPTKRPKMKKVVEMLQQVNNAA